MKKLVFALGCLLLTLTASGQAAYSSDDALLDRIESEGARLVAAGRTCGNLRPQLRRASCDCRLAAPEGGTRSSVEVLRAAEASVVVVGEFYHCDKCGKQHLGTAGGFFVSADGVLATCYHVVSNTNSTGFVVMTHDGRILPVRGLLAANRAKDVALLQVEGTGFTPLPLSTNAPVGMPVLVLSHPDAHFYSATSGLVSRYFSLGRRRPVRWMAITAGFAKGSSGAPVLDEHGNVVGLVDNTESIYYDDTHHNRPLDLQMVINNCAPAQAVLDLIRAP